MSLLGRIRFHGDPVTLYPALDTAQADGDSTRTYGPPLLDQRLLMEELSAEAARRIFGAETTATMRAFAPLTLAVNVDDGVLVVSGIRAGERYRVVSRIRQTLGVMQHQDLGLERTAEVFP